MRQAPPTKSPKQQFVYGLFYIGMFGSMVYDLIPMAKVELNYFIKCILVFYFFMDYIHLYFFMDSLFDQSKKDTLTYVIFDFLVALSFVCAYKLTTASYRILAEMLIAVWFYVYSKTLHYNVRFYRWFLGGSLSAAILLLLLDSVYHLSSLEEWFFVFTVLSAAVYSGYVISQFRKA